MASERRRPAPETAKDILGQLDTALERIGRARDIAARAGFPRTAAALATTATGIGATLERVEATLREDLAALLGERGATPPESEA